MIYKLPKTASPRSRCFAVLAAMLFGSACGAQTPAPSVHLSFGVDTTLPTVRDIARLTQAYLERPDTSAHSRGLWSARSPSETRLGDPATQAYQGFPATIIGISGVGADESLYVVKVLHASADSSGTRVRPLALQRFYAVRTPNAPYGWQLASPLSRLTHEWAHRTYGCITFWYAPGVVPNPPRARLASAFVDSVARLFAVRPPEHLDAYITHTTDESERLLGLDFFVDGSGPGTGLGGRSLPQAGVLLLGDPHVGEAYFHEFVHAVLQPMFPGTNYIFSEGVAVWLGGSQAATPQTMFRRLAQYQATHPTISLLEVLGGEAPGGASATAALYATNGLIIDAIYRRSGLAGLRRFAMLRGETASLVARLSEFVGPVGPDVNAWWRTQAAAAARR